MSLINIIIMHDSCQYYCLLGKKYHELLKAQPEYNERLLVGGNNMIIFFSISSLLVVPKVVYITVKFFTIIILNS